MFRNITVPLLGPATLFLVVWSSINALQLFDEVYLLTKGGPGTSTYVVVYYLYNLAFPQGVAGYAAAIAYVLFVAILILTLVQLWSAAVSCTTRHDQPDSSCWTRRGARRQEEPEPGRFLFSPWHLVLIPIAVVMLIPLVWMLVTSLETLNETRHFPPTLLPHTLRARQLHRGAAAGAVRALVPEHADRDRGHGRSATCCSAAWPATPSPGSSSSAARSCSCCC